MATYKEIKCVTIQTRDEDTTENVGTWASAPNLNAACREGGGSGTSTSAINVGGYPYPMTSEQWNGSTWATFANMGTPRGKNASAGTYTNAIVGNGSTPGTPSIGIVNNVETWNGSSWSEIAENNSDKTGGMAFGSNANSGFAFVSSTTEFWNGTSWTEVNDQSTGKTEGGSGGVSDSGLAFGGPSNETATEEWTAGLANKTITAS